jgi:hypothetical protein
MAKACARGMVDCAGELARIIHEGARPKAGRGRTVVSAPKRPTEMPAVT